MSGLSYEIRGLIFILKASVTALAVWADTVSSRGHNYVCNSLSPSSCKSVWPGGKALGW